MALEPTVWGPFYWFVLHTIALTYPSNPNTVIKRKYYDFIQNIPLFLPIPEIGNKFSEFLDKYPVTPYLDSRESFIKWMHFMHNKINVYLGLPEKTMEEAMVDYYEHYKPVEIKQQEKNKHLKYICGGSLLICLLGMAIYTYRK